MIQPIVILTETTLDDSDRTSLEELLDGGEFSAKLLVQADTQRHLLVDFVEHLSLLEFAEAFRELGAKAPDTADARQDASQVLEKSLTALEGLFQEIDGSVVDEGSAVQALVDAVKDTGASQAVVFTRPHAVLDTFHADLASKAQHALGLPVLHLYAGSGFIGDS
ncbi:MULTISPECIES: hypothetical protein [Arthrobacter]|uniref:Uncharacterized protein n=1 Tax=Arthrobacter woluwensis TaxID=156980 RepID=A0A1H4PP23_9MICC|nr:MULTISPECIES: hypothetical protein [Arthrobacter]SEC09061.1 hypothetical protein SAMN04489745_2037 [Arthrobacter woluwensis]